MKEVTIGITGHRRLTKEQTEKVTPVVVRAIQNIMFTFREHPDAVSFTVLSPLAEGADTIFAKAGLSLGLTLHVLLPFEREEYLKTFSSDEVRKEFDTLYNNVAPKNITLLNTLKGNEMNQLFLDVGKKLVDEIEFLITIWDEKEANGKGGTAEIVSYGLEKKRDVLLINPLHEKPFINYLEPGGAGQPVAGQVDGDNSNQLTQFVIRQQDQYDARAGQYNRKYKLIWLIGFVTGLLEVFSFAVYMSFQGSLSPFMSFFFSSIEFFGMLTILGLLFSGNSKKLHAKYVHYRLVGERLRIMRFFAELGINIKHVRVSPIYLSFQEKPEFGILDKNMKRINLSACSYLPLEEKKRLLLQELLEDQQKYHLKKKKRFEKRNRTYKNIRAFLFLLVIMSIFTHYFEVVDDYFTKNHSYSASLLPEFFHAAAFTDLTLFLSLFVPATIAACEALKYLYEWEKIITLSAAMARYFQTETEKLKGINSETGLDNFLNSINKDMLIENLDWEKYMQEKNEVPT